MRLKSSIHSATGYNERIIQKTFKCSIHMYIQFLYLYGGSMKKRKKFNPELYNKMEIPVAAYR